MSESRLIPVDNPFTPSPLEGMKEGGVGGVGRVKTNQCRLIGALMLPHSTIIPRCQPPPT